MWDNGIILVVGGENVEGIFQKVDGKGRVTIPVILRDELDLKEGEPLHIVKVGECLVIQKASSFFSKMEGEK